MGFGATARLLPLATARAHEQGSCHHPRHRLCKCPHPRACHPRAHSCCPGPPGPRHRLADLCWADSGASNDTVSSSSGRACCAATCKGAGAALAAAPECATLRRLQGHSAYLSIIAKWCERSSSSKCSRPHVLSMVSAAGRGPVALPVASTASASSSMSLESTVTASASTAVLVGVAVAGAAGGLRRRASAPCSRPRR